MPHLRVAPEPGAHAQRITARYVQTKQTQRGDIMASAQTKPGSGCVREMECGVSPSSKSFTILSTLWLKSRSRDASPHLCDLTLWNLTFRVMYCSYSCPRSAGHGHYLFSRCCWDIRDDLKWIWDFWVSVAASVPTHHTSFSLRKSWMIRGGRRRKNNCTNGQNPESLHFLSDQNLSRVLSFPARAASKTWKSKTCRHNYFPL